MITQESFIRFWVNQLWPPGRDELDLSESRALLRRILGDLPMADIFRGGNCTKEKFVKLVDEYLPQNRIESSRKV